MKKGKTLLFMRSRYYYFLKDKKFCRGQALTELVISLIAICVVLLAVILFSVAGVQGVKNVIAAREEADSNFANGRASGSGQYISYWENISGQNGDGMQFTADDTAMSGTIAPGGVFRDELVTSDGNVNMADIVAHKKEAHYDAFDLATVRIFLHAARLTSGSAQINDVLDDKDLYDVKYAIKRFGVAGKITIKDSVYMPSIYE